MDTPIELLRRELTTLRFVAYGRLMTAKKKEAKRLIPLYLDALELLTTSGSPEKLPDTSASG